MAVGRIRRIKEIIDSGIPTKDHGHIGISNEEAEDIRQICEKEISVQDRRDYHKTYYIKHPDKYNQRGKRNAADSEI